MNIKKIVKIICLVIILIVLILAILFFVKSGKLNKKDETTELKSRVSQEIKFLDDYIFSIANSANNINLENYILKSETISGQTSSENSNVQGGNDNAGANGDGQVGGNSGESGSGGSSSGSSSGSSKQAENSKGNQGNESNKKANVYIIEPSDILLNERTADWDSIKISVERLYPLWSTIAIDLYKLNVDNQVIQDFGKDLDTLTISVKEQNKEHSLAYLSKLYDYLINFGAITLDNNSEIAMFRTKSEILKAYAVIEQEKWEDIKNYIAKAEKEYVNIMGQTSKKNEYNVNRAYIILKEFQNSIQSQNKDILYIKYKNLLDELNIVSV